MVAEESASAAWVAVDIGPSAEMVATLVGVAEGTVAAVICAGIVPEVAGFEGQPPRAHVETAMTAFGEEAGDPLQVVVKVAVLSRVALAFAFVAFEMNHSLQLVPLGLCHSEAVEVPVPVVPGNESITVCRSWK